MKTFVRGYYCRLLSFTLMLLLAIPSLLLPFATIGTADAATGGRQNIIVLPLASSAEGAPADLSTRIIREVQISLVKQPGVEVNELRANSPMLTRAREQLEPAERERLENGYAKAIDPTAKDSDRIAAAGDIVALLGVDAVIFGAIDQYEFTTDPDPRQVLIRLSATKVTVEGGYSTGKPFVSYGKSRMLPNARATLQGPLENEAITNLAGNIVSSLTGAPAPKPVAGSTTIDPAAKPKPTQSKAGSGTSWIWLLVGAAILAGIAGGGGGDSQAAPPPVVAGADGVAFASAQDVTVQFVVDDITKVNTFQLYRSYAGQAQSSTLSALSRAAGDGELIGTFTPTPQQRVTIVQDPAPSKRATVSIRDNNPTNMPRAGFLYSYIIYVNNSDGSRQRLRIVSALNPSIETVGPAVPAPVRNLRWSRVGTSSNITLQWDLYSVPDYLEGYRVEYKLASDLSPTAWKADGSLVLPNLTSTQRTVPQLSKEYQYRVVPVSRVGSYIHPSSASSVVTVLLSPTNYVPAAPAGLQVQEVPRTGALGKVSLRLIWERSPDINVKKYVISRTEQTKSRVTRTPASPIGPKGVRSNRGPRATRGSRPTPSTFRATGSAGERATITLGDTQDTYFDDNTVEDNKTYTYSVTCVAYIGGEAFTGAAAVTQDITVNFSPVEVTALQTNGNPVGKASLKWEFSTNGNMRPGGKFEVYRCENLTAGTTTVSPATLMTKFTHIGDTTWSDGVTSYTYDDLFQDVFAQSRSPYRTLISYAIVADNGVKESPGNYTVLQLTPYPYPTDATITPTDLRVTAGADPQVLTITALDADGLPVPGAEVVVDCTLGGLSTTETGAFSSQVTLTMQQDGRAPVYWKPPATVGNETEVSITVGLPQAQRLEAPGNACTIIVVPPVAEKVTLSIVDDTDQPVTELVAVDGSYNGLDPNKLDEARLVALVTDNNNVPIPGRKVTFACTDSLVRFTAGTSATTDANGKAIVRFSSSPTAGSITLVAVSGTLTAQASLTIVSGPPTQLVLAVNPTVLSADGTSEANGTVTAKDQNGNPVRDAVVMVNTTLGSVNPLLSVTGSDGKASFKLRSGTTAAVATVKALIPDANLSSNEVQVTMVAPTASTILLSSNVTSIVASRDSQAIITAEVSDSFGKPVPDGTAVDFTVENGGVFQGSETRQITATTVGGKAIVVLMGTPATEVIQLKITATSGPASPNSIFISMLPKSNVTKVMVTAAKTTLLLTDTLADRQTTIDVFVTDNGLAVADTPVTISTTAGNLSQMSAQTDDDGYVRGLVFTAPDRPQVVTISATAKGVTGAVQITVRGGMPHTIELSLDGPSVLLRTNGREALADWQTYMYARVTDEYGNPVPDGTTVYFEAVEPNSYSLVQSIDPNGNQVMIPAANTGIPYGTIEPEKNTVGGSCRARLLSADRNTPALGAEILVRVTRPDGRVVFTSKFRTPAFGMFHLDDRIIMCGYPETNNSLLRLTPNTEARAGSPISISGLLYDDLNNPIAGHIPYSMTFTFEDGSQAAPPINNVTLTGGFSETITITDLHGAPQRTLTVQVEMPNQLAEPNWSFTYPPLTIKAAAPATMDLQLQPVVEGTSNTQIYTFQQPSGQPWTLGPDQMRVVAFDIKDAYGNPVTDEEAVTFSTGSGRFAATTADTMLQSQNPRTVDVTHIPWNGRTVAQAVTYYRCASQTTEKIYAGSTSGTAGMEQVIRVIGGATYVKFDFSRGGNVTYSVQAGCDAGSGYDEADVVVTALDIYGKRIPASDNVGVWINPGGQGVFVEQPSYIMLDANSQIRMRFKASTSARGPFTVDWKSGLNGSDAMNTGLTIVGLPSSTMSTIMANPSAIRGDETTVVTVQLLDADGRAIIKDSMTVQFAVSNSNFVMDPADGKVKVGDYGLASVKVKAEDPTKFTSVIPQFSVTATAAGMVKSAQIGYSKPAKEIKVSVGPSRLPTDADITNSGVYTEGFVTVQCLDDAGMPVPAGTSVTVANNLGGMFVVDGNEVGTSVTGVTNSNGSYTVKIRGRRNFTQAGNVTVTAYSGSATADNTALTFVGPPAKISELSISPAESASVGSQVSVGATVTDVNDIPVYDGYQIDAVVSGVQALVDGMQGQNKVPTISGGINFIMSGQEAGAASVRVSYGNAYSSKAYTFTGTGVLVFSYDPSQRIISDGTEYIRVTLNGYKPGTTDAVDPGTPVTLTTNKGHFSNGLQTISGTFQGGVFSANLFGEENPTAADLGSVTLTATSTGQTANGSVNFYGPITTVDIIEPASLLFPIDKSVSLTIRTYDVGGNRADGEVVLQTESSNGSFSAPVTFNTSYGQATRTVTPTVLGAYTVTATAGSDTDTLVAEVVASLPASLDVGPATGTEEEARVAAEGSLNPLIYTVRAFDVNGQPAGNITAQVKIERGIVALADLTFAMSGNWLDVPLNSAGVGTFYVNGAPGMQPGKVIIDAKLGVLTATSKAFLVGKAKTLLAMPSATRLLANGRDAITITAVARDSANQPVMDNTAVRLQVTPWAGGIISPDKYTFSNTMPKTVDGIATATFTCKMIEELKINASILDGDPGMVSVDLPKITADGADSLVISLVDGAPERISTDGIFGPSGTNNTQLAITATAIRSDGAPATAADLQGLPVRVATTRGVLNNKGASIETQLGASGTVTVTLNGTASTTPGTGTVTATSGTAATSVGIDVTFVGPADPTKFTVTSSATDTNGNGTPDVYQGGIVTLDVVAKDSNDSPVLNGTPMSITTGLTTTTVVGVTNNDEGKGRWQVTGNLTGLHDIFPKAGDVSSTVPYRLEVIPVADTLRMTSIEQARIYFDPSTTGNLPKQTSFVVRGTRGGAVQPNAEVALSTDMGRFIETQSVKLVAGTDGKEALATLNESGEVTVRFEGDGVKIGKPNIRARSGSYSRSINDDMPTPIRLVGPPFRIITMAKSLSMPTLTDDLRVMQDDPVTIEAEVQDAAGAPVLEGFAVDFSLPAGSDAILRVMNSQIVNEGGKAIARADLASNWSGAFTVTGQALSYDGTTIAGVSDPTTVTIRTYARTYTLDSVAPTRIAQDGTETAKIKVVGRDANGELVLPGTPVQFTILQDDPALAILIDPFNQGSPGPIQNTSFAADGIAEIYMRGQDHPGHTGTAGVRVASFNTAYSGATFVGDFPDIVTLYGPGDVAGAADLTVTMDPDPIVPGTATDCEVALTISGGTLKYYPEWYTLEVEADAGELLGIQELDPITGKCLLTYSITAEDAEAKLASVNPKIVITARVSGEEQAGTVIKTTIAQFDIAPKPWPGITDPAEQYSVDSTSPTTLITNGLARSTEGDLTLQMLNASGDPLGVGRQIEVRVSDGGKVRATGTPAPGGVSTTVTTGVDGLINITVTAPDVQPLGGTITLTLYDTADTTDVLEKVPAGALTIPISAAKRVADFVFFNSSSVGKVYYDPDPANQIISGLPLTETVIIRGLTTVGGSEGSSGAEVKVTTDKGQIRIQGTADPFAKSVTDNLDADGKIYLEYQGSGLDTELGQPTFTCENTETGTGYYTEPLSTSLLKVIGKPEIITVTTNPANANIMQDADVTLTATVLDKSYQPVLDGWEVTFSQSYTLLQAGDKENPLAWKHAAGDGIFRLLTGGVAKTANGTATATFTSAHSGEYTITAAAERQPVDLTDLAGSTKVTVKTYARDFRVEGGEFLPADRRVNCDGTEAGRTVITALDADAKRVVQGVQVDVRTKLGKLLLEDDPTKVSTSTTGFYPGAFITVPIDQNGQLRFLSRGVNRVGLATIQISNRFPGGGSDGVLWDTASNGVANDELIHYGPNPADVGTVSNMRINNIGYGPGSTGRIVGTGEVYSSTLYRNAEFVVRMEDAFGNDYPNGYVVAYTIIGPRNTLTGRIFENGEATYTFTPDLPGQYTVQVTVSDPSGVHPNKAESYTVWAVRPASAVLAGVPGSLEVNTAFNVSASVTTNAGTAAYAGFTVKFAVRDVTTGEIITITAADTNTSGIASATIPGVADPRTVRVMCFYDVIQNDVIDTGEQLAQSANLVINAAP
jgi:hypothetical protein